MQCMSYLFLLLIIKVQADDNVAYPKFPRQAEFLLESLINDGQHRRILFECVYDSDRNRLVVINEHNYEFYNYTTSKKAIYAFKHCEVYPLDKDNPLDGFSVVTNTPDQTTHIRSLEDLFLLTSEASYLGESILRGFIHVQQWKLSLTNDSDIIWSFAKPNYTMSWNTENYSVPVQRVIRRKSDGLILQVLNIFNYKTTIVRRDLTPPQGSFCADLVPKDELLSLQDTGAIFPERFSVRIDVSTSFEQLWQSVHLRYHATSQRKLVRYDYTAEENPITIIFDTSHNLSRSYRIDRRTGSCVIHESTNVVLMRSVLHNPIEALINYEEFLLTNPPNQFFQYTGQRPCRGSMVCETYIGQTSEFPSDREEDWLFTNIEWGWSKQDQSQHPVYLDLNLYEDMNSLPVNIHYEFYDYRPGVYLSDFDVNLCYRSNQLEYQHLAFQLRLVNQSVSYGIENHLINRRQLTESIRERMISLMSIEYLRISQLELDHQFDPNETLYCVFTLLDRTPFVDKNSQIGLLDAQEKLKHGIDTGRFQFNIKSDLLMEAVPDSLEEIQYFYVFNPDMNTTVRINRTTVEKIEYSYQIQALAIAGGMLVGILFGSFTVFTVICMIKRKARMLSTGGSTFENISFHIRNDPKDDEPATITIEHPVHVLS